MRLKRLIHDWEFQENVRNRLVLGPDVRLNAATHRIQLKEDGLGRYPTGAENTFQTWLFHPSSVKEWITFQEKASRPEYTDISYRVGNSVQDYFWNGVAWDPSPGWSTPVEIAGNLESFPPSRDGIRLICNLTTTDRSRTPEIEALRLLWASAIEFTEDILYRTMVPLMKASLRPITELLVDLASDTNQINLVDDYPLDVPYEIVGCDSVFNETDDSDNFADIYSSWNQMSKTVTLSATVAAGKTVRLRLLYQPDVVVTTAMSYKEVAAIPYVEIDQVEERNLELAGFGDYVVNVANDRSYKIKEPRQGDLVMRLSVAAEKGVDLTRLKDEVRRFIDLHPQVWSVGLDRPYDLVQESPFTGSSSASRDDLQTASSRLRIAGVLYWGKGDAEGGIVKRINVSGDMNLIIEEV